jgi:hypothetical protein
MWVTGDSQPASISNWLITPTVGLENGNVVSFYTSSTGSEFPDRLQVRLSLNGSSTNVGNDSSSVGDFTSLLLDINPNLTLVGYPATFTQYNLTLAGISSPTTGRIALRYFISENAGSSGVNGDYVGIDTFLYESPVQVPFEFSPSFGLLLLFGAVIASRLKKNRLKRGQS